MFSSIYHRQFFVYNFFSFFKVTKLFGTNYNNLTDSTQQLALLRLYGSYSIDSGDNDETPEWIDMTTSGELRVDGDQVTPTLVPSYSEALLLLDDRQSIVIDTDAQLASSVEGLDKDICTSSSVQTLRTPNVCRRHSSPSGVSLPYTPSRTGVGTSSAAEEEEQLLVSVVDNPPTYEEALMFPVVEHQRLLNADMETYVRPNIITATSTTTAQTINQSQFQSEIRLSNPNSRTFLSIETSL